MNSKTIRVHVAGPVGGLECAVDAPQQALGLAVVCHPHPLHGGTMDNKVAQTLARTFVQLGCLTVRFNFRGVGASEGEWDEGRGEVEDALAVIAHHRVGHSAFILAGFSFGGYVAAEAARQLPTCLKPQRLVLIGPSTQKQIVPLVPSNTIVIHGETDEVVPLSATLDWARPQSLPVVVFPGVGHFFHGQLGLLRTVLAQQMQSIT
jgi:uncharacterized protein